MSLPHATGGVPPLPPAGFPAEPPLPPAPPPPETAPVEPPPFPTPPAPPLDAPPVDFPPPAPPRSTLPPHATHSVAMHPKKVLVIGGWMFARKRADHGFVVPPDR